MIQLKERIGKLLEELGEMRYEAHVPIQEYQMQRGKEHVNWEIVKNKDIWGGHREYYYFKTSITVPKECEGKTLVYELRTGKEGEWDALNPQFLAYVNEKVVQGLDVNHREILLTNHAKEGEEFVLLLQAYTGDHNFSLHLDSEYKVLDQETERYYYDLLVPYQVARLLPEDSNEYLTIIKSLNESLNQLDMRKPHSKEYFESLKRAQENITSNFYEAHCKEAENKVFCVGHTHIDIAWLWTLKTTEDKAVRSFSTVLELMRQYPEYKFMSSQPQLYKYVKKNAPALYEEIKHRVAEGRWETEGGMFVEADCNIASGESLIRQFLHGTSFFKEEFGKKNEILWLPDVFGYSAALPQIMKGCGIKYFMTTKISWNEFNKMPNDTFLWEGIDGTKILTHFIPSRDYGATAKEGGTETEHFTTYNAMLNPSQVKGSWQRYSQKYLNNEVLMSYGYGDGGGGPTKEMLENQRRMERGIPGCPSTKQAHAAEFFHELEEQVSDSKYLPKWVGELYLEYHRGTYTSMGRNKRYNRKSEIAYMNLEFYRMLSNQLTGLPYPKEQLKHAWEVILRNQFHDILPGSSIEEVYEDSKAEYEEILSESDRMTKEALQAITTKIDAPSQSIVVFNPNSCEIKAPVVLPIEPSNQELVLSDEEKEYPVQWTKDGAIAVVSGIPAKGYQTFQLLEKERETKGNMSISVAEVETPYFHVLMNEAGHFTSIFDKVSQRELLQKDQLGNVIISYEDKPHNFDAWDINYYYTEKSWVVDNVTSIEVTEKGPERACIRLERTYLDSTIVQYLYFYEKLRQIDIQNEIDWKQSQILLRNYFPVDIHSNEAVYDIQYGNVKRPTHYNTSWDYARFEVCAHKWLDISEDQYGVSVLNDCKYGCNVHDSVIGLSMLKSGIYPNPHADQEHHTFWYSICPHSGDFREGNTVNKAYVFNNPYVAVQKENKGGILPKTSRFLWTDAPNAVIEVIKQQESTEDMIVRLYECYNRRGKVTVNIEIPVYQVTECNMLEEEITEIICDGERIEFELKPYEIKTLKLKIRR